MINATLAGRPVTKEQVRGTLQLLRHYRHFLASGRCLAHDPRSVFGDTMTSAQARRELTRLIHVAINRKAGIPDVVGRKQTPEYQASLRRECREVHEHFAWRRRLWGLNGRRFENDEIQARYGHLLIDNMED